MNKKFIRYIIIFTTISLFGIVLTQLFWIKKSIDLKKGQFDNSVRIAIKSVLNQLQEQKADSLFQKKIIVLHCRKPHIEISDIINPVLLDSLLQEELGCMKLNRDYYYGVFDASSGKFVMGNYHPYEKSIINSIFRFSLSSIYNPGCYYISVYFPDKTGILLHQIKTWLLLSVFFLISITAGFTYVTVTLLKQKKISEMKNDFVNNMTHELKTPLATTSLAAELLLNTDVVKNKKKIEKYARIILDENLRLKNMVEQVLQVSMLEKSKNKFKFKKTDIHKLLETVIESMDLRIKNENIKFEYLPQASFAIVLADRIHLMNVFFNLIDNAIKYSPVHPHIVVKTTNTKWGIHIFVKDNGIGIKAEHQQYIFKNFYRVPKGDIHEVRGFGLGLYYAYNVIKNHNGDIKVKSQHGKGSEFDVYLPFKIK